MSDLPLIDLNSEPPPGMERAPLGGWRHKLAPELVAQVLRAHGIKDPSGIVTHYAEPHIGRLGGRCGASGDPPCSQDWRLVNCEKCRA